MIKRITTVGSLRKSVVSFRRVYRRPPNFRCGLLRLDELVDWRLNFGRCIRESTLSSRLIAFVLANLSSLAMSVISASSPSKSGSLSGFCMYLQTMRREIKHMPSHGRHDEDSYTSSMVYALHSQVPVALLCSLPERPTGRRCLDYFDTRSNAKE